MGVNYSVLGLIFASMHDSSLIELTKHRTMGSVLFGGRYRLIDFPLSNMVNSGIVDIGVITKSNYGSLLDHLGSGRDWDLSRKKGGLHLLPPYSQNGGMYNGRLDAINNIWPFIESSNAKYVVMSDCNIPVTMDLTPVIKQLIDTEADIVSVYGKGFYNSECGFDTTIFDFDENNQVKDVLVDPPMSGECNIGLNIFVMSRELLKKVVLEAKSKNQFSFTRHVLQERKDELKISGYEYKDSFKQIASIRSYYTANLDLLDTEKRNALFKKNHPIYTKIADNGPVKYGIDAKIKNSLIADGCIIEGTVENSVVFRGVKIGKGTVVKDSVISQGTVIENNCQITKVVTDKNVKISEEKIITGSDTYPLYISKNAQI